MSVANERWRTRKGENGKNGRGRFTESDAARRAGERDERKAALELSLARSFSEPTQFMSETGWPVTCVSKGMQTPGIVGIESKIYFIRDQKVLLDSDLALLYGVETRVLNQAVRRNRDRFPSDFMFQLHENEWDFLKSHFVTSNPGRGGKQKLPFVFTEYGAARHSGPNSSTRSRHSLERCPRPIFIGLGAGGKKPSEYCERAEYHPQYGD